MKYLIGNWKANKTLSEAQSWIAEVKRQSPAVSTNLTVVLCPAFTHLTLFREQYPELTLGCQDISPYGDGAYTGAVTARMVKDAVDYVILGHSERRRWFHETDSRVAQKVTQALDWEITPIVAVHAGNWRGQLRLLGEDAIRKSIIIYEPPEAISRQTGPIGVGDAAPLAEVRTMIQRLKEEAPAKAVIYGGSIKSQNLTSFLSEPTIDGVLPGSASLHASEWVKMVQLASQVVEGRESEA